MMKAVFVLCALLVAAQVEAGPVRWMGRTIARTSVARGVAKGATMVAVGTARGATAAAVGTARGAMYVGKKAYEVF